MKLKPLLPALKEKKRYLSFEIISESMFPAEKVAHAVSESALELLGTLDAGKAGIIFLKDKYHDNHGTIRVGHRYVDKVRTALMLIKKIDDTNAIFRTRIVSGTLKKATQKYDEMKKAEA